MKARIDLMPWLDKPYVVSMTYDPAYPETFAPGGTYFSTEEEARRYIELYAAGPQLIAEFELPAPEGGNLAAQEPQG